MCITGAYLVPMFFIYEYCLNIYYKYLFHFLGSSRTRTPLSGLRISSTIFVTSDGFCTECTLNFRSIEANIVFSSIMANFWPLTKRIHNIDLVYILGFRLRYYRTCNMIWVLLKCLSLSRVHPVNRSLSL